MAASSSRSLHEVERPLLRVLALLLLFGCAAAARDDVEPRLLSVYPIGGQQGTTYRAVIRGRALDGAYGVWFTFPAIEAKVLTLNADPDQPEPTKRGDREPLVTQRLEVDISIPSEADPGRHLFRVVTPQGVSNPLGLYVHREEALREQAGPHELPSDAQPLAGYPAAIHGGIREVGEVDYYSFTARKGEELLFEAFSSDALDAAIALYEPTGSWFDLDRAVRLAFHDEPVAYPGRTTEPSLTYEFQEDGDFLVRVNGFWGHGGPDHSYVLRILPATSSGSPAQTEPSPADPEWNERTWTRKLEPDRMKALWSRAVPELAPKPPHKRGSEWSNHGVVAAIPQIPVVHVDAEPKKAPVEPPEIPVPALIVGTIEHPGDIDRVRFSIKEGSRLVLEVETPEKTVPRFNPYLRVVDAEGVEAFSNIHSYINSNRVVGKQIHPKTSYAFPRNGEFTLEIRDITANDGDREMRYRVLVRPQVPHMGAVSVETDYLNLVAGEAKKLSVTTDQEEGYDGYVVLSIEGLPQGVSAVPATEVEPDSPPPFNPGKVERFTTKSKKATFVFLCERDAPSTRMPVKAHVYAQPVMQGKLGARIAVRELLIMVVRPPDSVTGNRTARVAESSR